MNPEHNILSLSLTSRSSGEQRFVICLHCDLQTADCRLQTATADHLYLQTHHEAGYLIQEEQEMSQKSWSHHVDCLFTRNTQCLG